ncbi:hypothetical protein [Colwellia sp. BRX10-4]|uniref:hypothetical protein n=1 Tax=Colwellia sp. BRX10-4 TaxID=2759843 RepID=UPI0015F3782F|nr:hypothetical protein [Colwellia sp. BRX10-4]MBA6399743.1 hypothetical protein [Colwellia sp. BRX10-4]
MKKEKIAPISCFTICIITTIAVLNQVLVQDIDFEHLFSMLGMVFVFFSMACTPWMFFTPINEIFSKLHSSTNTVILKVGHVNIVRSVGLILVIASGVLTLF